MFTTFSVEDYVASLADAGFLQDKLSKRSYSLEGESRAPLFPPHLTPAQIHDGIKSGKLLQGSFLASRENYLEGSVNVEGREKFVRDRDKADDICRYLNHYSENNVSLSSQILLQGRLAQNRAVDGDIVAIELLPEDQWSVPSDLVIQDEEEDPGDSLEDEDQLKATKLPKNVERTPTGIVVGIIRRKWRQYCGILQPSLVKGV